MDGLAGEIVAHTNDGSLGDTLVEDQSRLNLSSRETVPRDTDDIWVWLSPCSVKREPFWKLTVYTAFDPDVTVLITGSAVTSVE